MNIAQLERDVETKRTVALALVQKTAMQCDKEDNRLMTKEERAACDAAGDELRQAVALVDQAKADASIFAGINAMARPVGTGLTPAAAHRGVPTVRQSLGQQFTASDAYEFIRRKGHRSSSAWRSPVADLAYPQGMQQYAATLTEDPASGGALVVPQYLPGILPLAQQRIVVANLLAPGTTDSNLVSYMEESSFVNAAAAVLEGGAKAESTLTFTAATAPVRKIAHWLPVTEELLEDQAQIESYINARLTLGVQLAEEDELLNGSGIAPHVLGILTNPGLAPSIARVDPSTNADALAEQFFKVYASSYLVPDGFVLNPINWAATLLAKTSTGEYLVGGPFNTNLLQATLWGLPVAATPEMVAGTGLVGAFRTGAQIFRHGGIRVEASNSHQDYFVKNLVAIRAEERLALAVYRPGAFGTVTALSSGAVVGP